MTITVGMYEAKTQLPRLISALEASLEDIVITRHGKPVARIVPIRDESSARERAARLARLQAARDVYRAALVGPPPTTDEIVAMIREGRDGRP